MAENACEQWFVMAPLGRGRWEVSTSEGEPLLQVEGLSHRGNLFALVIGPVLGVVLGGAIGRFMGVPVGLVSGTILFVLGAVIGGRRALDDSAPIQLFRGCRVAPWVTIRRHAGLSRSHTPTFQVEAGESVLATIREGALLGRDREPIASMRVIPETPLPRSLVRLLGLPGDRLGSTCSEVRGPHQHGLLEVRGPAPAFSSVLIRASPDVLEDRPLTAYLCIVATHLGVVPRI